MGSVLSEYLSHTSSSAASGLSGDTPRAASRVVLLIDELVDRLGTDDWMTVIFLESPRDLLRRPAGSELLMDVGVDQRMFQGVAPPCIHSSHGCLFLGGDGDVLTRDPRPVASELSDDTRVRSPETSRNGSRRGTLVVPGCDEVTFLTADVMVHAAHLLSEERSSYSTDLPSRGGALRFRTQVLIAGYFHLV